MTKPTTYCDVCKDPISSKEWWRVIHETGRPDNKTVVRVFRTSDSSPEPTDACGPECATKLLWRHFQDEEKS